MGLMLSILIGCVGALELLACLRHVTDGVVITIDQPATPCLAYHEASDNTSMHDSICSYSHSSDVKLPRGAKHKLENLHEYSLRIRAELRSLDKDFDYSALSQGSREFLLGSRASPDSRLSPDFNYLVEASESLEDQVERKKDRRGKYERETCYEDANESCKLEGSSRDRPLSLLAPEAEKYVRIPTPVPFDVEDDEFSGRSSGASSDVGTSFDNDSGNEAPTRKSFESIPAIKRYKSPSEGGSSIDESDYTERRKVLKKQFRKSHSKSPEPARSRERTEFVVERSKSPDSLDEAEALKNWEKLEPPTRITSQKKVIKSSSTIVRKPTRLKSKNAETNGPTPLRLGVRRICRDQEELASVEAVAGLEEGSVLGLSESRRDRTSRDRFGRRSFKNRRFGSRDVAVDDDQSSLVTNATASVERPKDETRLLKISSFEEADQEDYERIRTILTDAEVNERKGKGGSRSVSSFEDEEFWDAEDVSAGTTGPILYSIPDPDRNKAFWVMTMIYEAPPVSLRVYYTRYTPLTRKHLLLLCSHSAPTFSLGFSFRNIQDTFLRRT
ncbi:hypothetical protein WH47_06734 [Habropoda laboriosa]|uniref:Uncharacterized protein n=1 Tax=Habropoda laboriosa TaxID=597456 RepID=A0A0L7RIP0_9HYME|nr:hypothetical protein WH47_06734 [Habropoda laboriosa]